MLILSTAYLAPIAHYHLIKKHGKYLLDGKEHFVKRSQRNRCKILAANGKLSLSIPLKKYTHNDLSEAIKISYEEDWQSQHWKSIQSAYSKSAFFEFYADDFKPFFDEDLTDDLLAFNQLIEDKVLSLLEIDVERNLSSKYLEQEPDWRELLSPKSSEIDNNSFFPFYQQVFGSPNDFYPNLSIIDLLFNLGPASRRYLDEVKILE